MRGSVHVRCKGQFDGRWKEHTFAVSDSPTPTRPGQHTLCFEPSIHAIVETLGSCMDRVNIACTAMAAGLVIWVLGREIEGWMCSMKRRRDGTRIEQPWRPMQTPLTTSGTRWGAVKSVEGICNDLYQITINLSHNSAISLHWPQPAIDVVKIMLIAYFFNMLPGFLAWVVSFFVFFSWAEWWFSFPVRLLLQYWIECQMYPGSSPRQ